MTYEEIQAAVLGYSDRFDAEVAAFYPSAIPIVEGRLNGVLTTRLSLKDAIIPVTVAGTQSFNLPNDLLFVKQVEIIQGSSIMVCTYVQEAYLEQVIATNASKPFYTVTNKKIKIAWSFLGNTTESIALRYEQLVPPLVAGTSNWVSIAAPQIYIFGLLTEVYAFVKDTEAAQAWNGRFKEELDNIENTDHRTNWSGISQLQMKLG